MSEEIQTGVAEATPEVTPAEQAPAETPAAEATPDVQEPANGEEVAPSEESNEQPPAVPSENEAEAPAESAPAEEANEQLLPPPAEIPAEGAPSTENTEEPAPQKPANPRPPRGPRPPKGNRPQVKGFASHDEKLAWIAARHARNQQQLLKAGYPSAVVMSVMRFMEGNAGYENYAKDNLINCLCRLGENLLYRLDTFTSYDSADLMISIVDIYNTLVNDPRLHKGADAAETMRITQSIIDTHTHPKNDKISGILKHALGIKFVDGYTGRATYLFECLIDISMKMLDPFSGMLHDQRLKVPEELKRFYGPKKAKCRKCNRVLVYDKQLHGLCCNNEMCEDYKLVLRRRRDDGEGDGGGFRDRVRDAQTVSSEPVPQESQSDKFKKRFGKGKPFFKKRRPEQREPINKSFPPPGANGEFAERPFANLTLPSAGEAPEPSGS